MNKPLNAITQEISDFTKSHAPGAFLVYYGKYVSVIQSPMGSKNTNIFDTYIGQQDLSIEESFTKDPAVFKIINSVAGNDLAGNEHNEWIIIAHKQQTLSYYDDETKAYSAFKKSDIELDPSFLKQIHKISL